MAKDTKRLIEGIDRARDGAWDEAHAIAQSLEGDPHADWLHAILHKIEGDEANSRYWYRRTNQNFEAFPDAKAELEALKAALTY
ncbi:MAG: hypothetical protein KKB37_14675 [Alphaproteobacteria bacterium]|nr:hypothetical protein [Alphaproteobacteria bacterium]